MSYVLRLELPDRPGTLGAVATELGKVDADILAMDIVERSPDLAVDDIVVELPSGRQPDVLITAAESVPGVRVESVRPDPGVAARHREWELVEAIAADPKNAVATLARMLPQVLRAGWAAVVRVERIGDRHTVELLAGGGGTPDLEGVEPGWAPVQHATVLDPEAAWVPDDWKAVSTEMAAAPLWDPDTVVLVGRPGGPALRDSEIARLGHLAGLTSVVTGRSPAALFAD
ncbi:amino acid-binding protein [Nakamurella flava]|uniref:Amino acid-binding protein n=1 Tax=Nakamurella flava TaxID=2576308 RepID=A0A4U6QLN0_9ACTN|nr:amino acid-binding protein [Nakamurella flava]